MTKEEALQEIKSWDFLEGKEIEAINILIPELTESEDERIIDTLYDYVKNRNWRLGGPSQKDCLAWLEKQKEHRDNCTKFLTKILKHSAEGFRNILKKKGIDYIPHESFWINIAENFSKQECNEFYKWMDDMTMELVTEETPEYKKGFKDGLDASKKDQKPSTVEKLREISTPADEDWFEIQKQWEKEDEQKPIDLSEMMVHKEPYLAPVPTPMVADEQKSTEWNEKHIADVFEKVGLAKIVREQANDALTNAVQSAMLELSKVGNVEWSEDFEENIRKLLHDKLTWHSEDGRVSSTVLLDDKTLKGIINGIWFYVGKELNVTEWNEEDEGNLCRIIEAMKFTFDTSEGSHGSRLITWLKHLPERFNFQSKIEWSEEDEKRIQRICDFLWKNRKGDTDRVI